MNRIVVAMIVVVVACKGDAPKPAAKAPVKHLRVVAAADPSVPPTLVADKPTMGLAGAAPDDSPGDTTRYKVVVNNEEQYSIWPDQRENPLGWKDVGKAGTKAECLAYIEQMWTDMRPLSLRKALEEPPPN